MQEVKMILSDIRSYESYASASTTRHPFSFLHLSPVEIIFFISVRSLQRIGDVHEQKFFKKKEPPVRDPLESL